MKTLYLECNMGAAGDMLMAALAELHPDPEGFVNRFNQLNIPGIVLKKEKAQKCGIVGTHMSVMIHGAEEESMDASQVHHHAEERHDQVHGIHCHDGEEHRNHEAHHSHIQKQGAHGHERHHHTTMGEITGLIGSLDVPDQVKQDALAVYRLIAEAESHAHGCTIEEIHFHEVGTLDAVADVVGVCMLLYELSPERIVTSPVHAGSGTVHCAHGILPVPAPATAYILQGLPFYGGEIRGELCTPTGAALLKHFTTEFGKMPVMCVEKIGYGMGKKDFPVANCVRAMLGETEDTMDSIAELCCNLDDMTPEQIGFATELLMQEGALDVYTTAVQMKKNRPGIVLSCMCKKEEKEKFLRLMFRHTTTLGIREYICSRYGLHRTMETKETAYGTVRIKTAAGYGIERQKTEYEDLARIAREQSVSLTEAADKVKNC